MFVSVVSLALSTFVVGCGSSVKKADIAKTANPTEEVARLDSDISDGYNNQFDVLAAKDLKKSEKFLDSAKEGLRKNSKQEAVLEDIAYSRAYFERAKATTEKRLPKAQGVLDARKAAVAAGARNFPQLKNQLNDLDDELRDNAENFDKNLSLKEFSDLQRGYQNLELAAIQTTQIGNARAMIIGAKNDGAKSNAPKTLKQAEFDLKNAENTVLTNRYNPEVFSESVTKANASARLLVDVLATTKRKGSADLDEAAALKLVKQNYEIKRLRGEVGEAQSTIGAMGKTMTDKDQQLNRANQAAGIQEAMENARTQFNAEEAEVYQQGDKLLIRLKTMAFPSGRAELPSNSLSLLAKVKMIAEQLNPLEIVVEGHTDSTGNPVNNQKLSEQRAAAVAEYFETTGISKAKIDSVGYGFKKPIATNKSLEGRAQNRRVDIVITPGTAENAGTL